MDWERLESIIRKEGIDPSKRQQWPEIAIKYYGLSEMPVEREALCYSYNKRITVHLSHCPKVPKSMFSPKQDVSTKLTEMGYYTKRSRDESSSSLSISSSCRCTNEKNSHNHCPRCDGKYQVS